MLRVPSPLSDETEDLVTKVIGCAIRVHKALRAGLPERVYMRALCVDFDAEGIAYQRERPVQLSYRDTAIGNYRLDLVVDDQVLVEIKAVERLMPVHQSQVVGYLQASGLRIGLLINFNVAVVPDGLKRIVRQTK